MDYAAAPWLARQQRELAYHELFAKQHAATASRRVPMDIIHSKERRPWVSIWVVYDILLDLGVSRRDVLVPGCGFGNDAIRLAEMGARVWASDLSPEMLDVARQRARLHGATGIDFDVMPMERLSYADSSFDTVVVNGVLHHVDVPLALAEIRRVLRPGGHLIVNEPYTWSPIQKVRLTKFGWSVQRQIAKIIYNGEKPYITEDEAKLDENQVRMVQAMLQPGFRRHWLEVISGRIVPLHWARVSEFDRRFLRAIGGAADLFAGHVVLGGAIRK